MLSFSSENKLFSSASLALSTTTIRYSAKVHKILPMMTKSAYYLNLYRSIEELAIRTLPVFVHLFLQNTKKMSNLQDVVCVALTVDKNDGVGCTICFAPLAGHSDFTGKIFCYKERCCVSRLFTKLMDGCCTIFAGFLQAVSANHS